MAHDTTNRCLTTLPEALPPRLPDPAHVMTAPNELPPGDEPQLDGRPTAARA